MNFTISLTIDNGPEPEVTPWVLDTLEKRDVKATFFVVGQRAAAAQALVERAHEEGHWIGNHTWTHSVPLGLQTGPDVAKEEIARTQDLLDHLAHDRKLFRPFGQGGNMDARLLRSDVVEYLATHRFTCILWSAVPGDWADPQGWPETALAQCKDRSHSTLVVHDAKHGSLKELDRFITMVHEHGGRFVQDLPEDDIVMERGVARPTIAPFVSPYHPSHGD